MRKSVSAAKLVSEGGAAKMRRSQSEVSGEAATATSASVAASDEQKQQSGSAQTTPTKEVSKGNKKSSLLNKGFKYPADINFKAMEWLYDDDAV